MSWTDFWTWPRDAMPGIQADVVAIRLLLRTIPTRTDLIAMEARMSDFELQTRVELSAAILGALSAYDAVVVERDKYKAALEATAADTAAAVAAAVAEANDVNDAGDAAFNASQVDELRRLQPVVAEPAPVDAPPADPAV